MEPQSQAGGHESSNGMTHHRALNDDARLNGGVQWTRTINFARCEIGKVVGGWGEVVVFHGRPWLFKFKVLRS